jgi:hypothetical protein
LQARIACGLPLAVAGALLLGGCESMRAQYEPQPIEASRSMIRFEHDGFNPQQAKHTLHHDPTSANDVYVAELAGADAFATLVAYDTGPGFVVQERPPEAYVADLMREDLELTWGESGVATTRAGRAPYRMFEIVGQPFSCVGFGQAQGESSDDRGRKSNLLFGYFCQRDARPMTAETASDLISSASLSRAR